MNHTILQNTLPLVLHTSDLEEGDKSVRRWISDRTITTNLIVSAEHNVRVRCTALDAFLLVIRVRVIQITVDSF